MGNKGPASQAKPKFIMTVNNQNIILHRGLKMSLTIGQIEIFPHGLDGLKLWEAGIVLSRYVINNHDLFKGKSVLELGSGVGIGGITLKKWTECSSVAMTDYSVPVVENAKKNCQKNDLKDQITSVVFDWRDQATRSQYQFDVIIGSDIVYFGCPVKDLYQVFKQCLKPGGRGIIIIPDRKNYAQLFSQHIEAEIFATEIEELKGDLYTSPVLEDEEESRKKYSLLEEIKFHAYHLIKRE